MGASLSAPSTNPNDARAQQHADTGEALQTPESNLPAPDQEEASDPVTQPVDSEEEEEGECGFCLFMKGGGCRDSFVAWENCVAEAENNEEDIVEKCFEVTGALKKCMEAHAEYYAPILRAEKAAEEEVVRELHKDEAEQSGSSSERR